MHNTIEYIAHLKAHQREALLPLYEAHATYLLRAIKTLDIAQEVLDRLPTYLEVATCHEVALNSLSGALMDTHQNPLGLEAVYTEHPKAKNVGRDLRVRLIWSLIQEALEADITLADYETYFPEQINAQETYKCPYCNCVHYVLEREVIDYHDDGTPNFYTYIRPTGNVCCPVIANIWDETDNQIDWISEALTNLREIELDLTVKDLLDCNKIEYSILYLDDPSGNRFTDQDLFIKSPNDAEKIIKDFVQMKIQEDQKIKLFLS